MKSLFFIFALIAVPLAYAAYLVFRIVQLAWVTRRAETYAVCPACHRRIPLRMFLCDQCGTVHDLVPTEEEIFHKRCGCGKSLPKLPQNGRDNLVVVCTNHQPVFTIGRNAGKYPEMLIPIVGGTSSGKSALLAAWTVYSQQKLSIERRVGVFFPFTGGRKYAEDCLKRFSDGIPPAKTSETNPLGLGMDIVSGDKRRGVRVYFYDPAGEVFDYDPNSLQPFHYYDYMNGALFVIDPFSTPVLRNKYSREALNSHGFQASDKSVADSCEKFIRGMRLHHLRMDEYHYASCAVVVTKADAFDLDSLIGAKAVQRRMAEDPTIRFADALDEVCSEQLRAWGMGHVLKLLDEHFKEVRCFSVSAYGHPPQAGIPFVPERVELPILWLLDKKNPKLVASQKDFVR